MQAGLSARVVVAQNAVIAKKALVNATAETARPSRAPSLIFIDASSASPASTVVKTIVFNLYLLVSARVVESFWFIKM